MKKFLHFLKKPIYNESFVRIEWSDFFILLGVLFLLEMPLGVMIKIIIKVSGLEAKHLPSPYLKRIILGLIIGPFFEELLMRLYLVFTKRNILLLIVTCFGLALYFFFQEQGIKVVIFIVMFFIFFLVILNFSKCRFFFIKYYMHFFYFTAAVFGLLHISNFTGITFMNFMLTPIIIIPQIIMGLFFGYIRVTYGFFYSTVFHSLVNIPILLSFMI